LLAKLYGENEEDDVHNGIIIRTLLGEIVAVYVKKKSLR